ncbi:MAG: shikimate dehydrogenase [Anaerolineales bacterium]|nr:MAG: shikimate dehydrogenase [Anaerolineales bacterium]
MVRFGLVVHPLDARRDMARRYPLPARLLPQALLRLLARLWPPVRLSGTVRVRSEANGTEVEGWLVACPLTARQMRSLPTRVVERKVIAAARLAQRLGADIVGLGGFASPATQGGVAVACHLGVPVTTGHCLTVAAACEALEAAGQRRSIRPEAARVAIVGATGSIGAACASMLAPRAKETLLVGLDETRLAAVRRDLEDAGARGIHTSCIVADIREADLVLSATNAVDPVIHPQHLKPGAIVCDMAVPADVSSRVADERSDVLVIKAGIIDLPGEADLGFDLGLPPGTVFACMAEPIVLALEGKRESYSLGRRIGRDEVRQIARLARKHGFGLTRLELGR